MSSRNSFRNPSHSSARSGRNQLKLQKLRDQVRQSTNAFMARQHARLAWWQSAFRTPTLVGRFVSGFNSLWMAFLGLFGLSPREHTSARSGRGAVAGKVFVRSLLVEGLEPRQLMAIEVLATDTFVQEDLVSKVYPNNGQFTVQLSGTFPTDTTVKYTLSGTANLAGVTGSDSGDDYTFTGPGPLTSTTGTLTIPANKTQLVVDVNVIDDLLFDGGNESIVLTISDPSQDTITAGKASATINIVDNEIAPTISIAATTPNAAEPGTNGKFTVTMTGASDKATTVELSYLNPGNTASIAVNGGDYTAPNSVFIAAGTTFQSGSTTALATVTVNNDTLVEGSETVTATLGNIAGNPGIVLAGASSGFVTIADTTDLATVSIGPFSPANASEPATNSGFVITQTFPSSINTVVSFTVTGTALADTDYHFGNVVEVEPNDTFFGPQNGNSGPQGLIGFSLNAVADIDSATTRPHVSIAGTGNGTVDTFAFYVSAAGNATFDIDGAGPTTWDSFLELFDSSGASLITSNDMLSADPGSTGLLDSFLTKFLPAAGVYYIRVSEAASSTTNGPDVGENYTLHVSADNSTGFGVIAAGSVTIALPVIVINDSILEPSETAIVTLSGTTVASDAQVTMSGVAGELTKTVTIDDEDTALIQVSSTNAVEPSTNGLFTFKFPTGFTSSVNTVFTVVIDNGVSTTKSSFNANGDNPSDHSLAQTTTLTILANASSVTLSVPVLDSSLIEDDETLQVTLTKTAGDAQVSIPASASMLFGDEDAAVVDVDATFAPAVEGGAIGKFTFFLSEAPLGYPFAPLLMSDRDVVIKYTVGGTAGNGSDYKFLSGTATIPAFSSTTTILVDATGAFDDILLEGPETVSITITQLLTPTDSNINIGLGSPSDSLVINDNDSVKVSVAATTNAIEGNPSPGSLLFPANPGSPGVFTFSASGPGDTFGVSTVVTYQVKVASSTAVQGVDFQSLTGTVVIPAGVAQTATVNINAIPDILFEGNETVTLEILSVTGKAGVIVDPLASQATGLIIDDESGAVTIANKADAAEGGTNGSFTVSLGGASPLPTIVKLEVLPASTAISGTDYTAIGGPFRTITFNPFQTQITVPVNVIDDGEVEPTESVIVEVDSVLSGVYTASAVPATVSILSNQTVKIVASDAVAAEPSNNGEFVLSLNTGALATTSSLPTVVTFTITSGAGQATDSTDYKSIPLSVTIPANATTVAIPVSVIDDNTLEYSETVTINLTGISSGNGDITIDSTPANKTAMVTISDEDKAYVTVKATDPNGSDNPGSDDDGAFTVFISNPSDTETVVTFTITGTANPAQLPVGDYVSIPFSVTIAANTTSVLIPVDVLNDAIVEGIEDVKLTLTGVTPNPTSVVPAPKPIYLGAIGGPVIKFQYNSFAPGFVQGYTGTQDTYLSQTFGSANFNGVDVEIDTDSTFAPTASEHGLVRFDNIFGSTLIPTGSPIASAVLGLTSFNGGPIVLHQMLQNWNEVTQTWNNALLNNANPGIQADGFEAAVLGQPFTLNGIGLNNIPVTTLVQAWSNGTANFGWAFLPGTALINASFDSSADAVVARRPQLTVTLDLSATVTITDTDTAQVNVTGFTLATEPGSPGSIIVSMANPSSSPVTVFYQDNLTGTAISGSDYEALPVGLAAFVVIPAGQTSASIVINPLNDSLVEAPESVNITLLSVTSADPDITLGATVNGSTNIVDTDFTLITIVANGPAFENAVGNPALPPINSSFTVSLSTPASVDTVVALTVTGTAVNGTDFTTIPLSVTIPANFLTATIPVLVIDDLINEAPIETVTITLTSVTAGHLAQSFVSAPSSATVNLTDDEQTLTVTNAATKAIATEGGPNGEFQFQLNFASDNETVITYKLNPSTATPFIDGTQPDFNASSLPGSTGTTFLTGTVTIPAGSKTVALPVVAFQDYVSEPGETVNLQITSITNANPSSIVGTGINTVTIQDVVYTVTVVKTDSPAAEPGPPAGSNGQFTFTLTSPLPEPTVIKYVVSGTAIPSPSLLPAPNTADYVGLSGTVTIPANATEFKLSVNVIDDLIIEGDETVIITLTSASSTGPSYVFPLGVPMVNVANGPEALQTETINDNDAATVSIAGVDGTEAGQPAATLGNFPDGKFVISQTAVSSSNTVVTYEVQASSTAINGTDYTAITGTQTATILAGNTSVTVIVDVLDDTLDPLLEGTETVVVKLLSTTGTTDAQITIGTNVATVNIADNDTATISIVPTGPFGFEPGTNDGQYSVILSAPSSVATVVTYSLIAPGPTDATPDSDFKLRNGALALIGTLSGTVTIPAGQTSTPIIVDVLDDNIIENNEAVNIKLTGTDNPSKITVNATPATVTILDFGSVDQDRGKVTIAKLIDGSEAPLGAGKTDGKFILTLNPTNPMFNLANGPFSSDENTVVTYTISGGSAGNPSDHTLALTGTVTIQAGQTTAILTVPVVDDNVAEVPETLQVTLTGLIGVTHVPAITFDNTPATIAMLDDDSSVLTINSVSKVEGNTITFTVTSPTAVSGGFTVAFSVADVTTGKFGGADFGAAVPAGLLSFTGTAGETQTIAITTNADNLVEADETFTVTLGATNVAPALVTSGAIGTGTITNDDQAKFKINDVTKLEGTTGSPEFGPFTTTLVFTLSVDNPIDQDTTVDVDFSDVTAFGGDFDPLLAQVPPNNKIPISISGFDYDNDALESAPNVTQYKFLAGSTTKFSITVLVAQDNIVEGGTGVPAGPNDPGAETFTAVPSVVTTGRNTVISTSVGFTGVGTITDDDSATVSLLANDNKASEPLDTVNLGNGQFTVTQTAVSSSNTVIKYTVAVNALSATPSGTSALEDDYTKLSGTVTILAGQTTATIDVTVLDNTLLEDDETVTITLDSFVSRDPNVTFFGKLTDTVTIFDDDQATVSIAANDAKASEDPLDNGQFTLTLSSLSDTDTVVTYSIALGVGQATSGSDYTALTGTATIAAGKTTTTIDVVVLQDVVVEGAETVTLTLTGFGSPTNADIKVGTASDTVTIADDIDGIIVSVVSNGNGTEGGGNGSFIVRITKSDGITPVGAPATGLTVSYSSAGGTAVGGPSGDHVALTGSIFIPPGATTGLIDVSVIDDSIVEVTETVNVELVALSLSTFPSPLPPLFEPVTIGTSKATVNIIDNDTAAFTINSVTVNEGAGTAKLTVSLSNPIDILSKVDISLSGGNATGGGVDYDSTTQTVSFAANSTTQQSFTIAITDDLILEGVEGFGAFLALSLSTPLGGRSATFGIGSVTILDNEVTPLLQMGSIRANGSNWNSDFRDAASGVVVGSGTGTGYAIPTGSSAQTRPLPWVNVDRLVMSFSTPLQASTVVAGTSVIFTGTLPGTPAYTTLVSGTNLIISFASALPMNSYKLAILDTVTNTMGSALDGEFINGLTSLPGAGNGVPGGSFGGALGFRFVVSPGDATQNGLVDSNDANLVFAGFFTSAGAPSYSIFADMTANNLLDSNDANVVYANFFASPPVSFPGSLGGGLGSLLTGDRSGNNGLKGNRSSLPDALGSGSDGSDGKAARGGMDFDYLFGNADDEDEKLGLDDYPELGDGYADLVDGVLGNLFGRGPDA